MVGIEGRTNEGDGRREEVAAEKVVFLQRA